MTTQLVSSYEKALAAGDKRKFEVVLLNYDDDAKGQAAYMKKSKMVFPSVKHEKTEKNGFSTVFDAQFLPTLVLLDKSGKVLSTDEKEVLKRLGENS